MNRVIDSLKIVAEEAGKRWYEDGATGYQNRLALTIELPR
jgi:hypothetical protein